MAGRRHSSEKQGKKGVIVLVIILVILILVAGGLFAYKIIKDKQKNSTQVAAEEDVQVVVLNTPKVQIVDTESKTRPYAVMINNNHAAWPQCGLKDAYIVYEIIAEGGITRMMALYKDKLPEKVGSVRSARHYFIDYADENDAIFIHWGGSPQAYNRIYSGVNDIDGIALEGSVFFRDRSLRRDYEHTGFVDLTKAQDYAEQKGYTRDTDKDLLLDYSVDEIDLSTDEEATEATEIVLRYSDYHTTSYEYDEEEKVYKRSMSGKANIDLETEEQYTAKNIIVYKVGNYTINDGEGKGRQDLENIGSGEGYFITNGYCIPITWEKEGHSEQTIYRYNNGEKLKVSDGNTFIQICPLNAGITIE